MKIGRMLPPAAAPLEWRDLWHGIEAILFPGRAIRDLETEIAREFAVTQVFLVSSGTAALTLALDALKSLRAGREVVAPAYTCFSVPAAILRAGLRPALCDISPATFDFDHRLLERAIGDGTLAVVAHHLFGVPSAVADIRALCRNRGVFVIEDAAQAMGVESDGHKLGTLGDIGIFSLGRGKNITCGSGGILVTNSAQIGEAIARQYRDVPMPTLVENAVEFVRLVLMTIFIRPWLYWLPAGLPFLGLGQTVFPKTIRVLRLSGMKAGVLRNWRTQLDRSNRRRSETVGLYRQRLGPSSTESPRPYIRLPLLLANEDERRSILAASEARGLGLSAAYPAAVSDIPEVRVACPGGHFPSARRVARQIVTLPTHHWLSEHDKSAIADLCRRLPAA
jgi:perosamine synthetase